MNIKTLDQNPQGYTQKKLNGQRGHGDSLSAISVTDPAVQLKR